MRIFTAVLIAATAFAAPQGDSRFNGRWDISGTGRASWLEISGAGTDHPTGKFVSAFNGDLNIIEKITVRKGEIEFSWPDRKIEFAAKLENGKLAGTKPGTWTGVRAPQITEKDDASWKPGRKVSLFNGKDLTGWTNPGGTTPKGWSVKDGALTGNGGADNLVTTGKFWNYQLHLEYKMEPHSNSGIGLRGRYEVQIQDDYGKKPETHSNGALYSRIAPSTNACKPAGEWQSYDIRIVGRQLTVVLNGQKIIDKGEIEGLTAIAINSDEGNPGPLVLQGDHGPVQFRNVELTELVKK